jgi:PAS domain S-box-containing protein
MVHSASLGVLLDHAQDKITLLDENGRYRYANAATEQILGWEPDDLLGESVFEFVHPDDREEAQAMFEETVSSDVFIVCTAELRYKSRDGSWVRLECRMSNATDEELDGYVVSSRDVTDRVEAQRERCEVTQRLEELTATTGDVLWMFDGDWSELLFVNPAYEEVMGQSVEAVQADPSAFLDAIHPEDVSAVEAAMERLSAGESVNLEYRVNPNKDYRVWVWAQATPIIEDGEVVRISGFSRDITDRYRRERQLYVMDNLLRHNLRNDMNTILGNVELIREEAPEVADRTRVIRQTGENLLASAEKERQIIDLLTGDPDTEHIDLCAITIDGVETVQERYPEATVEVSLTDTGSVYASDQVGLAVVELLENAIAHSEHDEPTVHVTVRSDEERTTLVIEDDAPTIPEVEAQVLTGAHSMTDIYHSTGLGLWLAYWAVDLSDGEIAVDPADEEGNRITVTLPQSS